MPARRAALALLHEMLDGGMLSPEDAREALLGARLPGADDAQRQGYELGLRTAVGWLHRHRFLYAGDMLAQALLPGRDIVLAQPLTTPIQTVAATPDATITPLTAPIDLLGDEADEARVELIQEQQEHALDSQRYEHAADL